MEILLVVAVLAVAVLVIAGPLRRGRAREAAPSAERDELEARKDAKYREIHEAELDYRMGKLAPDHWRALDSSLRAEAIELLRRLDALERREVDH